MEMEETVTITRRQRNSETNESQPALNERSAKLTILKTSQLLFSKEMPDEEQNYWLSVMDPISVAGWRYAFENWNRNGRFFPKPKDILELVDAYKLSKTRPPLPPGCPQCVEGWVKVHSGTTPRGNEVDAKVGGVVRCECFGNTSLRRSQQEFGCEGGFGATEIMALFKKVQDRADSFRDADYVPLTDTEIVEMCREVEARRV